jgi:hypothetical protein
MIKEMTHHAQKLQPKKITFFQKSDFPTEIQNLWPDSIPALLIVLPFHNEGVLIGGLLLGIQHKPEEAILKQLEWLCDAYGYAWRLLSKNNYWLSHLIAKVHFNRRTLKITGATLVLMMIIRIPQTVMAPVSVIPKDPTVVTSPLEGAIEKVYVKPDQEVEPGTILFEMEKRDLKNQYELALRELDTAKAKLDSAIQTGFKNIDNRAEINALQMEEKEKRLKVQYTEYRLQEANVKATEKGVAIIDNPERWVGRPVSMGERIMLIGQRERVQFEVWLPVSDAIEFKAGDAVNVYLTEDPLTTLHGQVAYSSFDASMTPKQVLAYRVIADLNPDQTAPHIGSQGTAKIIGKRVSFFYYLFRKPIGFLRQSFGW